MAATARRNRRRALPGRRTVGRMGAIPAAVLPGPAHIRMEERALLTPGPAEAVVQVFASGLCGTDYRIWNGDRAVQYPLIMGHEFIGEVVAVGSDVQALQPGLK